MSKEKQIEDFENDLRECHTEFSVSDDSMDLYTDYKITAQNMIGKGWSKQSEGEWITKHRHRGGFRTVTVTDSFGNTHTGTLDDRWECDDLYCSVCGKISHDAFLNYCANCGAKMKGGAE